MIDARSLHGWLGVGRTFANWLRERAKEYGFELGVDYSPISADNTGRRGKPRKEYLLTLDMAKELAMVERTDIGRSTRRYFIHMEKAALEMAVASAAAPINPHPRTGVKIERLPIR